MSNIYSRMSPRAKAITKIAGTLLAGGLLVGGCNLVVAVSPGINQLVIEGNPSAYIRGVSDYLARNQAGATEYMAEISELVRTADSLPSLPGSDRLYLFESNASRVELEKGIDICDTKVIGRADEEVRLEYLISSVDKTDNRHYLKIIGRMVENVGVDAYNAIADVFRR